MRIVSLKINKFRAFTDAEFTIGKNITVLSGSNAVGKSTILGLLGNSCELKDIPVYDFRLAVSALFLNRTNRGGIITGGPIGGHEQKSKYSLDCRFNKVGIVKKIRAIAEQSHRIRLYMLDAKDLINGVLLRENPDQLFTFFDPPYYKQGQALYKNAFNHEDHETLSKSIKMMNAYKWITTYDECPEIQSIYSDYRLYTYKLRYSVNQFRKANEYLFASPTTKIKSYDKVKLK